MDCMGCAISFIAAVAVVTAASISLMEPTQQHF